MYVIVLSELKADIPQENIWNIADITFQQTD